MGCGASVTVKNESPALEARVSLPEFKQWYLKLLVKDASKAAKVGPRTRVHARWYVVARTSWIVGAVAADRYWASKAIVDCCANTSDSGAEAPVPAAHTSTARTAMRARPRTQMSIYAET